MKRLLIILSLFTVVDVQAAHSDGYVNELQARLEQARRRAEGAEASNASSSTPPASQPPRRQPGRLRGTSQFEGLFGGGDTASSSTRPAPQPPRAKPPVARKPSKKPQPAPKPAPRPAPRQKGVMGMEETSLPNIDDLPLPPPDWIALDGGDGSLAAPAPGSVASSTPPVPRDRNLPICVTCQAELLPRDKDRPDGDGEKEVKLSCGHLYHDECIRPWVTGRDIYGGNQHNCPTCRKNLTDEDKAKFGITDSAPAAPQIVFGGPTPEQMAQVDRIVAEARQQPLILHPRGGVLGYVTRRLYDTATGRDRDDFAQHLTARLDAVGRYNVHMPEYNLDELFSNFLDRRRALAIDRMMSLMRDVDGLQDRLRATPIAIGYTPGEITVDGVLNLDNKGLSDISGLQRLSVADKAKVKRLSLRNNGIRNLPADVFSGFPNLVEIDIAGNPLDGDVSPYATDISTVRNLQAIRGLDLGGLLEVRQMLNQPIAAVPEHLHAIHRRPLATEILDKLIQLTLEGQ